MLRFFAALLHNSTSACASLFHATTCSASTITTSEHCVAPAVATISSHAQSSALCLSSNSDTALQQRLRSNLTPTSKSWARLCADLMPASESSGVSDPRAPQYAANAGVHAGSPTVAKTSAVAAIEDNHAGLQRQSRCGSGGGGGGNIGEPRRVRALVRSISQYAFLLLLMCLGLLSLSKAHAAMPVFDAAALSQSMRDQVMAVEQWARDNINQARQIEELLSGNTIATDTQNLMDKNYAMRNKHSWSKIRQLQQESLTMLYATKALWDEFGSANRYYASFRKADAWKLCMRSHNCTFSQTMHNLEDSSITQAIQAYRNAETMNERLQGQIQKLQSISDESQSTDSQAATLDALSKINGSVAGSMVDLNAQVAQLTKLQSHSLAKQSNKTLADEFFFQEVAKSSPRHKPDLVPVFLP